MCPLCQELFSFFYFCCSVICGAIFILSCPTWFVNTFFHLFTLPFLIRQGFVKMHSDERRRRDLNPRAAINDLLPFQGSPFGQLGYFSIKNGEGGIRTHAPLRTNGFQDRLVMTTSIPLHNVFCCCRFVCLTRRLVYNTKPEYICQHFFQSFFIFFVFSL